MEIRRSGSGNSYPVYAEALNGAVDPSQFDYAIASLCRNTVSDAGWPPLQVAFGARWRISASDSTPARLKADSQ